MQHPLGVGQRLVQRAQVGRAASGRPAPCRNRPGAAAPGRPSGCSGSRRRARRRRPPGRCPRPSGRRPRPVLRRSPPGRGVPSRGAVSGTEVAGRLGLGTARHRVGRHVVRSVPCLVRRVPTAQGCFVGHSVTVRGYRPPCAQPGPGASGRDPHLLTKPGEDRSRKPAEARPRTPLPPYYVPERRDCRRPAPHDDRLRPLRDAGPAPGAAGPAAEPARPPLGRVGQAAAAPAAADRPPPAGPARPGTVPGLVGRWAALPGGGRAAPRCRPCSTAGGAAGWPRCCSCCSC